MDFDRQMEVYQYADRKARFLYNEGYRTTYNGKLTKQLRAIINNYCKKDGFHGIEVQMISLRIAIVMTDIETNLYR